MKVKYEIEFKTIWKDELEELLSENGYSLGPEIDRDINPDNLYDQQKYDIVVKLYRTLTLEQLQNLLP